MPEPEICIYALQLAGCGPILYVGQTSLPQLRLCSHRSKMGEAITLRTLRMAHVKDASRIEAQIIRALKRRGQCERNKITESRTIRKRRAILFVDSGQRFETLGGATRARGCAMGTMLNYLKGNTSPYKEHICYEDELQQKGAEWLSEYERQIRCTTKELRRLIEAKTRLQSILDSVGSTV